ncbi:hypothetical protein DFH07DRAFT_765764 [Mycena maculata]|uniref:Uncharacterized protein n=1 Tax=Mycena maculata TaxID=230809 RepID=A0AAD7NXP3_9AGAR|nr:hypothetical protein DFH07DRAFT_765764 [Mycena maculata]
MAPDSAVHYNGGRQKRLSRSLEWTSGDVCGPSKTHPSAAKHVISTGWIVKMSQIAPDKRVPYNGNTAWVCKDILCTKVLPPGSSTSQDRSGNSKVEKTAVYGNGRQQRRYKIGKIILIAVGGAFRHARKEGRLEALARLAG